MSTLSFRGLSQRFRPQKFSEVQGQDLVVQTLKNALQKQITACTYLFCGAKGTGKTTLARLFAKALNCKDRSLDQEPCGVCASCTEITQGQSLDFLEIDGASHRGIDDIRQIQETAFYAPSKGSWKIYLIDEVHMLTKEAFNAFLKILEEPPPQAKFFLATTEPSKIPSTVLSRCQRLHLPLISHQAMQLRLSLLAEKLQVQFEPGALPLLQRRAEGSMRVAEAFLEQLVCFCGNTVTQKAVEDSLGLFREESFFSLAEAIDKQDIAWAFSFVQQAQMSGKSMQQLLLQLCEYFRFLLLCLMKHPLENTLFEKEYQKQSKRFTVDSCSSILDQITQLLIESHRGEIASVIVEMLLVRIIRFKDLLSLEDLVRKLQQMQSQDKEIKPLPSSTEEKPVEEVMQPASLEAIQKPPVEGGKASLQNIPLAVSESIPPQVQEEKVSKRDKAIYETRVRFALVELEGSLQ